MKKKICIISTNRSDYDHLIWLYKSLKEKKQFDVSFLITGAHLSKKFGNSSKQFVKDKIKKKIFVKIKIKGDSIIDISQTFSDTVKKFTKVFIIKKPDLIIALGDRFELLAILIAASLNKIPIAHLNGGETTQGAQDEWIRHSITKMSNIHFVANKDYKNRVIQLGEQPNTVFNVGGLSSDNVLKTKIFSKNELEKLLKIKFKKKILLVTYHPETLNSISSQKSFKRILLSLKKLKDVQIIFSGPNNDQGNLKINKMINEFINKNKNSYFFYTLGRKKYFSILNVINLVVGNSSSGILEAPYMNVYTLNIGDRQKGRKMPPSVFNFNENKLNLDKKINYLLNLKKSRERFKNLRSYYGDGKTAENIVKILRKHNFKFDFKKKFFNLNLKHD